MILQFKQNKNKTLPPGFQYTVNYLDGQKEHSYAKITWVTNMEKTFLLHTSHEDIRQMYLAIKHYNLICEDQRNLDGFDDEQEDEVALLI
jgi:hypothetical protein